MFPFLFLLFLTLIPPFTHSLNQEGLFLQQVKQSLSDPVQSLSSWNDRDDTPCNWTGIKCDPVTRRVNSVDLSNFELAGPFPTFLCRLPSLSSLSLFYNNINDSLPADISTCQDLQLLNLSQNLLVGPIPSSLSKIPNLRVLDLSGNNFSDEIPASFGEFRKLETLGLFSPIPDSLGGLSRLTNLDLSYNKLTGSIPNSITDLKSIVQIELYENALSGELPSGLSKLTTLLKFDVSMNEFDRDDPRRVVRVTTGVTEPVREFGSLPSELGKNSPLQYLDVSYNGFSGAIPNHLCEKGALIELILIYNSFSGEIPESLGKCQSLNRVRFKHNNLSGMVPESFWGLSHVSLLELAENSFSGSISTKISSANNLSTLLISKNKFSGLIPQEVGSLRNLVEFSGSENMLTGPIPGSIVKLSELFKLDLSKNEIFGEIPVGIKAWKKLNELNLANNRLYGYLGTSRLLYANENYRNSFVGNPGLCGDLPDLCPLVGGSKKQGNLWILLLIFIFASIVLIVGVVWFYFKYQTFKKNKKGLAMSKWRSFHKLCFSEYEIVGCLNEDNVIGSGASGKVYKVVLSNGEVVAVKKLWGGTKKGDDSVDSEKDGFEAEVETLGKIRHKNIVKLWCCYDTGDCKLLVYEYMPKGSLGDLLHSSKKDMLDWPTRYRIALDAADGLSYLHHDCVPSIVHRDVKSNNILLDAEFRARVADFGVAKVVAAISKDGESMSVIAGSCGYIAPEYAYTLRVNEKSDIYSFGVVILELITGRRPIDPEFGEKDLVKWVCTTLDQKGIDHIIDPMLDSKYKTEISKVLDIGLLCTSTPPINRPSMRKVVKLLQEAGAQNKPKTAKKAGNFSPYFQEEASYQGGRV
uniref:non-specific serine/threonine protein kinase n=1 Tax=Fagus sylvatica TaxID=28930 RepID=A0A2N9ELU1_FAGSY